MRFVRIVEIGSVSHEVLDDIDATHDKLWKRHYRIHHENVASLDDFSSRRLNLVVFGTTDFVSIQEVPDLKTLGVVATRKATRFQRSTGAWAAEGRYGLDDDSPYVSISYLKLNPLADLAVGHELPACINKWVLDNYSKAWPLYGLDSAGIVVIMRAAHLRELERFIWRLRKLTLDDIGATKHADPGGLGEFVAANEIGQVQAVSWSHSVVGLPVDYVNQKAALPHRGLETVQHITLRTRYRLMPHCRNPPDKTNTVLGNHDLVRSSEPGVTTAEIVEALRIVWRERAYLVETEVEFLPDLDEKQVTRPGAPDGATSAFLRNFEVRGLDLDGFPALARGRRWSYQRTNGAVNLLLAYMQRLADPFDLGQIWRLRQPFAYWLEAISRVEPQDESLVRWAKHLERAIRLEDDQEDPTYRPSLPLSFASRGGYVVLRETFVAYVEEMVKARADAHEIEIPCPLIVDSIETRLSLKYAFGTFILLVSGFQIQAMPLWPYVVHEIEHICLGRESPRTHIAEAICDRAMIDSGALGIGCDQDELLERAAKVIAWSLLADLGEKRQDPARPVLIPLRLAYLHVLVVGGGHFSDETMDAALESKWWRKWATCFAPHSLSAIMTYTIDGFNHDRRNDLFQTIPARRQSAPKSCATIVAELVREIPTRWEPELAEENLQLQADSVCRAITKLRGPVWQTRRHYLLELGD